MKLNCVCDADGLVVEEEQTYFETKFRIKKKSFGKFLLSQAQYSSYIGNRFWWRILLDESLRSTWLISDLFHNFIVKRTRSRPQACVAPSSPVRAQDERR